MKTTFLIIALLLITSCGNSTNGISKDSAAIEVQFHVEDKLKSPSTASFGHASVIQMSDSVFQVENYVDAQNGFGATVRNYYSATIEYFPGKKIKISDLEIY